MTCPWKHDMVCAKLRPKFKAAASLMRLVYKLWWFFFSENKNLRLFGIAPLLCCHVDRLGGR